MASSSTSLSKRRHRHTHTHKQHPPHPISLTHLALTTLLFLATLSNFLLAVLSTAAWTSSRRRRSAASSSLSPTPSPLPEGCLRSARRLGHVYCGFTRWGLFLFLSVGALLCAAATATMTVRMLGRDAAARHRRSDGGRSAYVLRGALFTVCVYAPLIYLGWADVTVVGPALAGTAGAGGLGGGDNSSSAAAGAMAGVEGMEPWDLGKGGTLFDAAETPRVVFFEGITGAFILQSMDAGVPTADAAMMAAHLCLFFALLITGIAAATDRSFPVKVGDAEKATGQTTPSTQSDAAVPN